MFATVFIVIGFGSSSALAAAYGIAVTLTMVITVMLLYVVMTERWQWPKPAAIAVMVVIPDDRSGVLRRERAEDPAGRLGHAGGRADPLHADDDVEDRAPARRRAADGARDSASTSSSPRSTTMRPARVPGTAVFMTAQPTGTPPALVHNLRYNKVLHEHVVILTVVNGAAAACAAGGARIGARRSATTCSTCGCNTGSWRIRTCRSAAAGARSGDCTLDLEDDLRISSAAKRSSSRARRGHGDLAREAVRADGAQCRSRHCLLPAAA